jgi:hypothetical protein
MAHSPVRCSALGHDANDGTVPPSAIKYCVSKGWLLTNESKTLYRVTLKAAIELNPPLHFKGINGGRKIPSAR